MDLNRFIDEVPTVEEALMLFDLKGAELSDLYSVANKVRSKYAGNSIEITTLTNAKSGSCTEGCSFCSQSMHNQAIITEYSLKEIEKIVDEFDKAIEEIKGCGYETNCAINCKYGFTFPKEAFCNFCDSTKDFKDLEEHNYRFEASLR